MDEPASSRPKRPITHGGWGHIPMETPDLPRRPARNVWWLQAELSLTHCHAVSTDVGSDLLVGRRVGPCLCGAFGHAAHAGQ